MPRIRTIKPELWESEKLGSLSAIARLTFIGLISLADDEGRGRGEPRFLLGRIHPYSNDVDAGLLDVALRDLGSTGLVEFYKVNGCSYYEIPGWSENQRIDHPTKSKMPKNTALLINDGNSREDSRGFAKIPVRIRDQGSGIKDQGSRTRERKGTARFARPSISEVKAYCQERNNGVDPQAFIDFYESKGWQIGRTPMKSWQAAIRTWERRENGFGKGKRIVGEAKPVPGKYENLGK